MPIKEPTLAPTDPVKEFVAAVTKTPILQGQLHTIALAASASGRILHGLGRRYRGWIIVGVDNSGAGDVYDSNSSDKSKFLELTNGSANDLNLTVWVF